MPLSAQELIDCDTDANSGCKGGTAYDVFDYIIDNDEIDTEDHYPYIGRDGKCDPNREKVMTIDSHRQASQ